VTAASIANFFATTPITARQDSDGFILAPKLMRSTVHNNPNIILQPDEFKLYRKQYDALYCRIRSL
jgi:hypothetical protein